MTPLSPIRPRHTESHTTTRVVAHAMRGAVASALVGVLASCAPGMFGTPPSAPVAAPAVREVDAPVTVLPMPPAPDDPEPTPAASDSAGVARLVRLTYVWHLLSLHHPAAEARGVPLDSAYIRAVTLVRRADNADALQVAYARFLAVLNDPVTRVEQARDASGGNALPPVRTVNAERTRDSILLLQFPTATQYEEGAAVGVREALRAVPSNVVLDLRTNSGGASPDSVDAFVARTQLAERLASVPFTQSGVRVRRVGGAREVAGQWRYDDSWMARSGALVSPVNAAHRRIVVLANEHTVLPRAVMGLLATGRATLIAEGRVSDEALVPSVAVTVGAGLVVRMRTGELVHADGSSGIVPDTTVAAAATPSDSAPALRAALSMLRRGQFVRASRLTPARKAASLPSYYDTDPYPYMGSRVLGAARLWSVMRARHAHRDLYDDDIDALFERTVLRLEAARYANEYAAALLDFASAFDDVPTALRGASVDTVLGIATVPFRVRWADGRAVISDVVRDSVTQALGLVAGLELLAADGYPLTAWMQEQRRRVSAPNDWVRQHLLSSQMSRGPVGNALFRVRDVTGRERQLTVPRRVEYWALLPEVERPWQNATVSMPNGVVYLDINRLTDQTVAAALQQHRGARAWILDLRGALSDTSRVGTAVLQAVRRRASGVVARELHRYQSTPCLVETLREATQQCADERELRTRVSRGDTSQSFAGRLVALVDERTWGNMERLALALEGTTDITFVGTPSAGSPAEGIPVVLPGGLSIAVPAAELRRADGSQWQRVGITPLVDARLTLRSYRGSGDEVMERAHQWLVQQLDGAPRRRR